MRLLLIVLSVCFLFHGCASKEPTFTNYLEGKPILLIPDRPKKGPEIQQKATETMPKTLSEHNIGAYACRRGNHCAEIQTTVQSDATVSVIRTPGQKLTDNEGNMLRQWMTILQREYKKNIQFVQ